MRRPTWPRTHYGIRNSPTGKTHLVHIGGEQGVKGFRPRLVCSTRFVEDWEEPRSSWRIVMCKKCCGWPLQNFLIQVLCGGPTLATKSTCEIASKAMREVLCGW